MILFALENGQRVYAYNSERKKFIDTPGHLIGYNNNFIAIKRLNSDEIDIFNEDGNIIGKYPFDFINMTDLAGNII